MKLTNLVALLIISLFISACSNKLNIETEYSKATNFQDFKYYRWHPATQTDSKNEESQVDELLDSNIRFMIDQQLANKGMIKNEQGPVDFLVSYSIASKSQVDVETQKVYEGYSQSFQFYNGFGYAGRYHTGVAMTMEATPVEEMMVDRYQEGTMTLDFIEPDNNQLIWRAIGDKRLPDEQYSPQERDKLINKTIGKLLAKFPPK